MVGHLEDLVKAEGFTYFLELAGKFRMQTPPRNVSVRENTPASIGTSRKVSVNNRGTSQKRWSLKCIRFFRSWEMVMKIGSKVRVLLVDDHLMVRQTLRSILQPHPNIEVVGEAGDGDEAVVSVGTLQPDVVVMDMNMQKMDGITAARLIKTQYPHVSCWDFLRMRKITMYMRCSKLGLLKF